MKAVKILLGLVVAAIAIVAIVVVIGLQNIDQLVKRGVEKVGPQVVGTAVHLEDVKISLTEGRGELFGLTIANPKGFSKANAFSLGEIALDIDTASLTGDVIVINEILISKAHLLAEQKGLTENNLQTLMDNVKAKSAQGASGSKTESTSTESEGADVLLAVKKFTFKDSDMRILSDQWGEQTLKMPTISLANLGSADKGLTPDELATAVIKPLIAQAKKAAQKHLESMAKEKAAEKVNEELSKQLGEDGAKKLNELKSLFGK